ncbi:uncharacterized protein [Epargyreus clarus]|uniref:uncharacterized protein n=1 Tax=Epargyreus clarus TaxID=520877 RepID=UPI003C2EA786
MKSKDKIYNLCIDIVTYKTEYNSNQHNMNAVSNKKNNTQNKFICSICLNQKCINDTKESEFSERKSKSCPICKHSCNSSTDGDSTITKETEVPRNKITDDRKVTRDVQTSQVDVTQGLSLLNEVLTVFQTKKQCNRKESRKTLIFKDIGVSTEDNKVKIKPKLTMSKVFQYSIEDKKGNENKFVVISSWQPEVMFIRNSLDLIKHKSSSIPQMKLEELKNSLKEKTKSKDAIEEANRIFATVKRFDRDSTDNRPLTRSGPRVLPVVKTANFENNTPDSPKTISKADLKCCHENNYHMSSGDSPVKYKCCQNNKCVEEYEDCVHMQCCHCKQYKHQMREIICKRCRTAKQ